MIFLKYLLLIILYLMLAFECKKQIESGPYNIVWEKYEICKGPKESCGKVKLSYDNKNMSDVMFGMTVEKNCALTMVKTIINKKQGNHTINIQTLSLNNPCDHYILGPLLRARFNFSKTCTIPKGDYEHHIDVVGITKTMLGPNFFYGLYSFKTLVYSRFLYLACYEAVISFKRK